MFWRYFFCCSYISEEEMNEIRIKRIEILPEYKKIKYRSTALNI